MRAREEMVGIPHRGKPSWWGRLAERLRGEPDCEVGAPAAQRTPAPEGNSRGPATPIPPSTAHHRSGEGATQDKMAHPARRGREGGQNLGLCMGTQARRGHTGCRLQGYLRKCRAWCRCPPGTHTRAPFLAANQPRTSNVGRRDAFRARKAARVSRAQAADRDVGQERRTQESSAPPRLPARAAWQACQRR